MGIMKRILEQQMDGRRRGLQFVNENPVIKLDSNSKKRSVISSPMVIDAFNKDVRIWGRKVAKQLRQEAGSRFTNGKTGIRVYKSGIHKGKKENKLKSSIRAKFRKEIGGEQIDTIAFGLERHGVFLQKGVGSGYVANGGGVARIAKSEVVKYRVRQNWFNNTLDRNIKSLSDTIVKHAGDSIVLNTKQMFIQ